VVGVLHLDRVAACTKASSNTDVPFCTDAVLAVGKVYFDGKNLLVTTYRYACSLGVGGGGGDYR
jgi:cysteine sulfinate desulfinase/cysteine desulfurase-like protein